MGVTSRMPTTNRQISGLAPQFLFAFVVPLVLLPIALQSASVALMCAGGLLVVTTSCVFGLARTGSAFVIMGFGTAPLNSITPISAIPKFELADVFFGIGFLLLIPRLTRTPLRIPTPFVVGGIGFFLIGSLSALAVDDKPADSVVEWVSIVLGILVFPTLLVWWTPTRRAAIAAAVAYLVGNTVSVVVGELLGRGMADRAMGLTPHPNFFGVCQTLCLALAVFLLGVLPREYRWMVAIASVVAMYGLWVSGSRAALLTVMVLAVIYPILRRSIPAAIAIAALAIPFALLAIHTARGQGSTNALARLLGQTDNHLGDDSRRRGLQFGIDQIARHPLLGDGWSLVYQAHDVYVQVASAIGLVGLVCFLLMLATIVSPVFVTPRPYGLLATPALMAATIGLVDPQLGHRYIWCLMGLALCAPRLAAPSAEANDTTDHFGPVISTEAA